jgi:thymidylate synthase (FAD)
MTEIEFVSEPTVKTLAVTRPVEDAGFSDIDLLPVNAARVSASGFSSEYNKRDAGLERRLIADLHGTPFEHAVMTFFIEVPLFVNAQWHTHRWSSFNQESARYSEMKPRFYLPSEEDWRLQSGKKMDYQFEPADLDLSNWAQKQTKALCTAMWIYYEQLMIKGIAREQARMLLPENIMTRFWWTVNLRSLANFLSLRTDEHAQKEIRDAAFLVEKEVQEYFPEFHKAWEEAGRKAIGA